MEKAVDKTAAQISALRGEAIEKHGLKLWGITMGRYEEWASCKNVWLARQSTFPVSCIMLSFLDALWTLDMNAIDTVGKPAGFLYKIMYCLGMALGLRKDCVRGGDITVSADEETRKLNGILVKQNGHNAVLITADMFNAIREIVAWQQGDELPDESMNDELLETERELASRNAPQLKYELMDMEASVALACGRRIKEVLDWSILEFEFARRAIDRSKKNLICGIGETNGCKWDGGNPYPSWCFDREKTVSGALIEQAKFGKSKTKKKE